MPSRWTRRTRSERRLRAVMPVATGPTPLRCALKSNVGQSAEGTAARGGHHLRPRAAAGNPEELPARPDAGETGGAGGKQDRAPGSHRAIARTPRPSGGVSPGAGAAGVAVPRRRYDGAAASDLRGPSCPCSAFRSPARCAWRWWDSRSSSALVAAIGVARLSAPVSATRTLLVQSSALATADAEALSAGIDAAAVLRGSPRSGERGGTPGGRVRIRHGGGAR